MFDDREELVVKAIFWQPKQPDGTGGCLSLEVEGIGKRFLKFWLEEAELSENDPWKGNPSLNPAAGVITEQGWILRKDFTLQIWPAEAIAGDKR